MVATQLIVSLKKQLRKETPASNIRKTKKENFQTFEMRKDCFSANSLFCHPLNEQWLVAIRLIVCENNKIGKRPERKFFDLPTTSREFFRGREHTKSPRHYTDYPYFGPLKHHRKTTIQPKAFEKKYRVYF